MRVWPLNLEKTTSLQENVNPGLLQSMREGNPLKLTGIPQRKPQENDAIPKIAPKWLKYDKQVSLQIHISTSMVCVNALPC